MSHVAPVIRMSCGSGRDHPPEIPGNDDFRRRSTYSRPCTIPERIDAARSHVAGAAANAQLPKTASRILLE